MQDICSGTRATWSNLWKSVYRSDSFIYNVMGALPFVIWRIFMHFFDVRGLRFNSCRMFTSFCGAKIGFLDHGF